jgi:PAS domain S-box-containing protein
MKKTLLLISAIIFILLLCLGLEYKKQKDISSSSASYAEHISIDTHDQSVRRALQPHLQYQGRYQALPILGGAPIDWTYLLVVALGLGTALIVYARLKVVAPLDAIIQSASDGIVMVNARGEIVRANKATAEIVGVPCTSLQGSILSSFFCDASKKQLLPIATVSDGVSRELYVCRSTGEKVPVEVNCRRLEGGAQVLYSVFIRNIQPRLILETQLRQAQKLESIGQLAAGIAHEINTPIQYIGDNTRFFLDEFDKINSLLRLCTKLDPLQAQKELEALQSVTQQIDVAYLSDEVPRALKQTLAGIERVTRIVQAMKEFSHPGGSEKVLIDINKIIESTVVVSTNEWKYVASVDFDLDPQLPQVLCFPNEISQVLLNLIINSAHAIEDVVKNDLGKKGKITVRTQARQDDILIEVSDTGAGIPEHVASKIYDPFFTTKGVGKGTGQGLAIVRHIVTVKHGGAINFVSTVGKGTTFTISLPLRKTKQQDTSATVHQERTTKENTNYE